MTPITNDVNPAAHDEIALARSHWRAAEQHLNAVHHQCRYTRDMLDMYERELEKAKARARDLRWRYFRTYARNIEARIINALSLI